MHFRGLTLIASIALIATACNEDRQLGGNCGTQTPPLEGEIVEGETAVDEVVRVERDGVCESFQCLTEGGLAPYCSELCSYDSESSNDTCNTDADCRFQDEHCIDHQCKEDDCPEGFICDTVQETGPLASTRYCQRQRGCVTNFDCGDVSNVRCVTIACLDACLLSSGDRDDCDSHYLHCQPRTELPFCLCPGEQEPSNGVTCDASVLVCDPSEGDPFPAGSVTLRGICVGNDQVVGNQVATADGT